MRVMGGEGRGPLAPANDSTTKKVGIACKWDLNGPHVIPTGFTSSDKLLLPLPSFTSFAFFTFFSPPPPSYYYSVIGISTKQDFGKDILG
jgi:hypothetical protein